MSNSKRNNDWKTSSRNRNIKDSIYGRGLSKLMNRIHSVSSIYILAGTLQILLGLTVIAVTILGYVQPLWLSTLLTGMSSISAMAGFFLVYHTVSKMHDPNLLLRNAMKRVMESKN
ncbi:hypothetical protein SAMN05443144_103167 [Fodinibius roseus]|uniref:Uncharacterized protein n=1 Tax=Fodinibius roseus TaxID=1194090 RepID=A0A1M4WAN3_9BACT|nr:hypothetical protein [Fodinibius roseus]SHE78143.1 hypothetical protein SAMN05443144_103167 [Fodinibius roseus]